MVWLEQIYKENVDAYTENRSNRIPWERDAVRFDDFRYNQHFSKAEERELLLYGQAPLPISITTAICDTAESLMVSSKPIIKVAPIINPYDDQFTSISKKVSQIYDYLLQKSWLDSLGNLHYDRVVRDYTNVGVGYFYIFPSMNFGEFNVNIKHISWRYIYPHSMTKDPFFRDMDNCVIAMELSANNGYKLAKTYDSSLTYETFKEEFLKKSSSITNPPTRYKVTTLKESVCPYIVRITLEEHKTYAVVPKNEDYVGKPVVKFYLELPEEIIRNADKYYIKESVKFYLTEYISIGSKGIKKVYPVSQHNIVPLIYDHRDSPYPLGRIWYLYPIQRAINKFIMLAILNGSMLNGTRVLAEQNSIVDEYEFFKNLSRPNSKLEYRLNYPGQSQPPMIIEAKPLGEAWLMMPRYLAQIMEFISGIFGVMMGDSNNSPDVFSTVAALQSAGGLKIKRRMGQVDAALSVVGKVAGEFYKEYAPINGFATMIDDNGKVTEPVKYNVIKPTEDKKSIEIDPMTDLSIGFNDVRFVSSTTNGYEAGTEAALLTNLATQLKVPQLVPLILKRLNIPDVDKILESMDIMLQQQSTIENLNKIVNDLESRVKILANQVTQKSFEVSKAQFDAKFQKILSEYKNNPELLQQLTMEGLNGQ